MEDSLKDLLRAHPETKAVYFNAKGEYLCYPRPGFDKKKTRDEILGKEGKQEKKAELVIETKMDTEAFTERTGIEFEKDEPKDEAGKEKPIIKNRKNK